MKRNTWPERWRSSQQSTYLALLGLTASVLVACGGGSGGGPANESNGGSDTPTEPSLTGYFRDAPVENLAYRSCNPNLASCYSGHTNVLGAYKYNFNDTVEFFVGDISLAEPVAAKPLSTPFSITASESEALQITRLLISANSNENLNEGIKISSQAHAQAKLENDKMAIAKRQDASLEALADRLNVPLANVAQAVEHLKSTRYLEQLDGANHPHARALLGKYSYRSDYYNAPLLAESPAARLKLKIWEQSSHALLDTTSYDMLINSVERRNHLLNTVFDSISSVLSLTEHIADFPGEGILVGYRVVQTGAKSTALVLSVVDNAVGASAAVVDYQIDDQEALKGALAVFKGMSLDLGGVISDGKDALGLEFNPLGENVVDVVSPVLSELSAQLLDQHAKGVGLKIKNFKNPNAASAYVEGFLNIAKMFVALDGARTAALARYGSEARLVAFEYLDAFYRGAADSDWMIRQGIPAADNPSVAIHQMAAKVTGAEYSDVKDAFFRMFNVFPGLYVSTDAGALVKKYREHVDSVYQSTILEMGGLPQSDGNLKFANPAPAFLCNGATDAIASSYAVGSVNMSPAQWTWQIPEGVDAQINQGSAQLSFPEPGIYIAGLHARQFAAFGSPSYASKGYYVRQCAVPNKSVEGGGYQVQAQTASSITYEIPGALRAHFAGWMTDAGATISRDPMLTIHYADWDSITPFKPVFVKSTEGGAFGEIVLWFGGLWDQVKSVAVNFGDNVSQFLNIPPDQSITSIRHTYSGLGPFTATVSYMPQSAGQGSALETQQLVILPNQGLTAPAIDAVEDNRASPAASVANGGSTADSTPVLRGTLAQPLTTGQAVHVYANRQGDHFDDPLGSANVDGLSWSFTPAKPFVNGRFTFEAIIVRALDGTFLSSVSNAYSVNIAAQATAVGFKLPHTGITADQCYQAGSSSLELCSGAGPMALNAQQDGHRASINPMSYSQVGSYSKEECVKDNVTGLIWEGKTASGTRAGGNTYTNFHSSYYGTQAQMDATSNSYGYVATVNAMALCGFTDWRLPTVDELQTIVDYSRTAPAIDTIWFSNTSNHLYLSSSSNMGNSSEAWSIDFHIGYVGSYGRSGHIRLVRSSL